jgi:hypothetical protein
VISKQFEGLLAVVFLCHMHRYGLFYYLWHSFLLKIMHCLVFPLNEYILDKNSISKMILEFAIFQNIYKVLKIKNKIYPQKTQFILT